jgi:serine/threonine-protein phosphatase PGAM5
LIRIRLAFCCLLAVIAVPVLADGPVKVGAGIHYVILVRHGMYDRDSTRDEIAGNGLNALGHEQARLAGARIASLPVQIASLVTSDYLRARETAEDMGKVMKRKPVVDTLIHECTPTSDRPDLMRSHTPDEIAAADSNLARAWARYIVPTPAADRHDVLVCHGNVIRWFVARTVSGDAKHWPWMDIGNASITIIAVRPDGAARLVCFSDVGHIPVTKQTWSGKGWGGPVAR